MPTYRGRPRREDMGRELGGRGRYHVLVFFAAGVRAAQIIGDVLPLPHGRSSERGSHSARLVCGRRGVDLELGGFKNLLELRQAVAHKITGGRTARGIGPGLIARVPNDETGLFIDVVSER